MANIVCKNCFLFQVDIQKNCYWNCCQRDCFGPCTMDRAAPDQLSIPLNKLPGGHKWSKTSCEDNLGNWRNWCDSRTSKSVASGKSFMDTWTTGSLVFSWNINMELASWATSYFVTISTESGSSSWTYPTWNKMIS